MKTMLFDTPVLAATGRTFAAETPPALIDGDRFEPVLPAGFAEAPRGSQPRHAAAEDGDAAFLAAHPSSARARASSGQAVVPRRRSVTSVSGALAISPNDWK